LPATPPLENYNKKVQLQKNYGCAGKNTENYKKSLKKLSNHIPHYMQNIQYSKKRRRI
jgi:hypothetical protein